MCVKTICTEGFKTLKKIQDDTREYVPLWKKTIQNYSDIHYLNY